MSEGGEEEPHEVSVEIRDEFQRQVMEYIKETRNEFQIVNGQISMLVDEMKNMKNNTQEMIQESMKVKKDKVEEEILSQGISQLLWDIKPQRSQGILLIQCYRFY